MEKNSATLFEIARAYDSGGQDELARAEYGRYIDTGDPEFATEAAARRAELEKKANPVRTWCEVLCHPPNPANGRASSGRPLALEPLRFFSASESDSAFAQTESNRIYRPTLTAATRPWTIVNPRISKGQSSATFTTGFLAAGVIAAGVSGYLWWKYLSQETSGSPAEPNAAQVFVTGDITDDNETIGLGIGGTF